MNAKGGEFARRQGVPCVLTPREVTNDVSGGLTVRSCDIPDTKLFLPHAQPMYADWIIMDAAQSRFLNKASSLKDGPGYVAEKGDVRKRKRYAELGRREKARVVGLAVESQGRLGKGFYSFARALAYSTADDVFGLSVSDIVAETLVEYAKADADHASSNYQNARKAHAGRRGENYEFGFGGLRE